MNPNYKLYTDLQLLYALQDCNDNYDIDTSEDEESITYIIEERKNLGLWDYSAEIEFWEFNNEIIEYFKYK